MRNRANSQDSAYLSTHVRSFFEDYLVCRRNLSVHTIRSYRDVMKLFISFAAENLGCEATRLLVTDIKQPVVIEFLKHLESTRGNGIQTRNHRLALLRRFFSFVSLQEPGLIDYCRRVMDIPVKRGARFPEITYLEKDEMNAILKAPDRKTTAGRRDYAILLFMYNTGARVQETADLCLSWISFPEPTTVQILGKGKKLRTCPLWSNTTNALNGYFASRKAFCRDDEHVFLNRLQQPISRFGITNLISKYKENAAQQIPSLKTKNISPHTIRHTTAMHMLQAGVDMNVIQHWLGHASLETTQRYVTIDLNMKRQAMKVTELETRSGGRQPAWKSSKDILEWLDSL